MMSELLLILGDSLSRGVAMAGERRWGWLAGCESWTLHVDIRVYFDTFKKPAELSPIVLFYT